MLPLSIKQIMRSSIRCILQMSVRVGLASPQAARVLNALENTKRTQRTAGGESESRREGRRDGENRDGATGDSRGAERGALTSSSASDASTDTSSRMSREAAPWSSMKPSSAAAPPSSSSSDASSACSQPARAFAQPPLEEIIDARPDSKNLATFHHRSSNSASTGSKLLGTG